MPKPDDLKIDLAELFGGDLSEAKVAAERQEQLRSGSEVVAASAEEQQQFADREAERESRYQEMLRQREEEIAQSVQAAELHLAVPVDPPEDESLVLDETTSSVSPEDVLPPEPGAVDEVVTQESSVVSEAPPLETTQPMEVAPIEMPPAEVLTESPPTVVGEAAQSESGSVEGLGVQEDIPPPPPPLLADTEASVPPPDVINFDSPVLRPFGSPAPSAPMPAPATQVAPPPLPSPESKAETVVSPVLPPAEPAPALVGPSPEEVARLQKEREYLLLYDQFRVILLHELIDLTGERKSKTMLARTVELARNKHPEIFKNTNWDADGNLLDDGSLDEARMLQNKAALDPARADQMQDMALATLYLLRIQAVEKGLGSGMKEKIKTRFCQWLNDRKGKALAADHETHLYDRLLNMAV